MPDKVTTKSGLIIQTNASMPHSELSLEVG
jgi:hypothetical protein